MVNVWSATAEDSVNYPQPIDDTVERCPGERNKECYRLITDVYESTRGHFDLCCHLWYVILIDKETHERSFRFMLLLVVCHSGR